MLNYLWRTMGDSRASGVALLGAFDEVVNPGAARARADINRQNHLVIPAPCPGDRMPTEGRIVIAVPGAERR
jgi:hypothetical protein